MASWIVRWVVVVSLIMGGCGSADPQTSDQGTADASARDMDAPPDFATDDTSVGDQGVDPITTCLEGAVREADVAYLSHNTFMSSDGSIRLGFVIQPDPDAFGTSGTTPFEPLRVAAVVDGTAYCVTDAGSIDYQVSHHNFDDTLTVTLGDAVYTWVVDIEGYDGDPPVYSLTIEPQFGPDRLLTLTSTGCSTTPLTLRCFGSESW